MEMVRVAGNTYPVKEQLKALGGRWDGDGKCWKVPADKAAEAQALVAAAPVDTFRSPVKQSLSGGELWEPCYCGTEPVCVNCFHCARHCGC